MMGKNKNDFLDENPKWEKVNDILPRAHEIVLGYYEKGKISMGYFYYINKQINFVDIVENHSIYGRVTHWMKLPDKPKLIK